MQNMYAYDSLYESNDENNSYNSKRFKLEDDGSYLDGAYSYTTSAKRSNSNSTKRSSKQTKVNNECDTSLNLYYDESLYGSNSNNKLQANEKTRLVSINEAFEILRTHIPTFPYERRLSKIDTLHLAISYINLLESVLESGMNLYDYLNTVISNSFQNNSSQIMKPCWATSGKLPLLL